MDNGTCPDSPMRADEFLDQGNLDGERLWMRIMRTIEELQRERPRGWGGGALISEPSKWRQDAVASHWCGLTLSDR